MPSGFSSAQGIVGDQLVEAGQVTGEIDEQEKLGHFCRLQREAAQRNPALRAFGFQADAGDHDQGAEHHGDEPGKAMRRLPDTERDQGYDRKRQQRQGQIHHLARQQTGVHGNAGGRHHDRAQGQDQQPGDQERIVEAFRHAASASTH